mmetsp:Transcript_105199/g.302524  ORF Transcript_105199/g.302524 Transcript_105199/m.302524 type:complete len:554 (-) Transcript_105199:699-2360(-)
MRERTLQTEAARGGGENPVSGVNGRNVEEMIPEVNRYLNAQNYILGVRADLKTLSKFVREELFYVFVHDFKNEEDDCLALACEEFVEYCLEPDNKKSITNPHIQNATSVEFKAYLRFLWKEGLKPSLKGRGNIRKDLSHEKSAVYASIADAFKKLVISCLMGEYKVPFPAYETFGNRTELTRRYFLFFNVFFKAGRHNKELWKIATTENHGKNDIPYGSPIFEAHVRTTIQENYFKWILQVLANPKLIPDDKIAEGFKTEYDYGYGELPQTLICDTPLITLPKNCQIAFDKNSKEFKIVTEHGHQGQYKQGGKDGDSDSDSDNESVCPGSNDIANTNNNDEDDDFQSLASTTVNLQDIQDAQNVRVQEVIGEHRLKHQDMLKYLKKKVKFLRALEKGTSRGNEANEKFLKEKWAEAKKKLRQFRDDDDDDYDEDTDAVPIHPNDELAQEPPRKKTKRRKEYGENKSRCSDQKVKFFSEVCMQLQQEDELGVRQSWEGVYKEIMNNFKALDGQEREGEKEKLDLQIPKYSTLLTNLKYCRVWRKARNNASIEQV